MLTAIVREAHYGEGTLVQYHRSGLLVRIMRRALVLAADLES